MTSRWRSSDGPVLWLGGVLMRATLGVHVRADAGAVEAWLRRTRVVGEKALVKLGEDGGVRRLTVDGARGDCGEASVTSRTARWSASWLRMASVVDEGKEMDVAWLDSGSS